jgi:hypothetical protein
MNILELFFGGVLLEYLQSTSKEAYYNIYELRAIHKNRGS